MEGWIELSKLIAPWVGAVVTVIGFGFVIRQLRLNRASLENQARGIVYQSSFGAYKLLVDHPDLRPFFYDGHSLPSEGETRSRVLSAAELLADFFENIVQSRYILDPEIYEAWENCIRAMYRDSVVFADFIASTEKSYSRGFRKVLTGGVRGPDPK